MADGRTLLMVQVMIVFFLYLMGYHSAGQQLMGGWLCTPQSISIGFGNVSTGIPIACAGTGSFDTGASGMAGMADLIIMLILGLAAIGVATSVVSSNFGLIYAIPAVMISAVVVLFLTPLSFMSEIMLPYPLNTFISLVFGMMLIYTIITFVRGGEL